MIRRQWPGAGVLKRQMAALGGPWMRFFVRFDPAVPLEAAVARSGDRDVTIKVYPDANHLFIPPVTGSPAEHATLEKRFVPGLLEDVTTWIRERAR